MDTNLSLQAQASLINCTEVSSRTGRSVEDFRQMESFLLKTVKRLRKETPRRLKEFRLSCDELICKISFPCPKTITYSNNSTSPLLYIHFHFPGCCLLIFIHVVTLEEKVASGIRDDNANQYFVILEAGCETRVAKLMEVSLDAVHYLIGKYICILI